jgi:preprotein translocase subunit YajC
VLFRSFFSFPFFSPKENETVGELKRRETKEEGITFGKKKAPKGGFFLPKEEITLLNYVPFVFFYFFLWFFSSRGRKKNEKKRFLCFLPIYLKKHCVFFYFFLTKEENNEIKRNNQQSFLKKQRRGTILFM